MSVKTVRSLRSSGGQSVGSGSTALTATSRQQKQDEQLGINPDNPVKLYTGPIIDTTDRSIITLSKTVRFDPSGFRFDRPLQKDIFHADPYITCSNCNFLSFVDVVTIRRMLSLPAAVSAELRLAPEILPPCTMCQCADCFVIGSHDFAEEVAERKRLAAEKRRMETAAATRLQQSYRRYLRRMYGIALCDMFLANKYLTYVSALKITSAARGRLARRIARTERALLVIRHSHPLLIRHSLRSQLKGPKVFWYKRQVEIDMLYANYLELVKKTGFTPARKLVEDNIIEIARRVLVRQNQLIVLVQRRWRGFMARRIVRYFRTEISRLFQFRVSRVMKIQRVYRGHAVRLLIPVLIAQWERKETMDDYLSTSKDAALYNRRFKASQQVMGFYGVERSEEKTARYTSRVAAAEHFDNKKMAAFWDSPYADDRLGQQVDKLMGIEYGLIKREKDAVAAQLDRKVFMENKIAESGPPGFGLRGVPTKHPPRTYFYDAVLSPEELGLDEQASSGINLSSGFMASMAVNGATLASLQSARSKVFRVYFRAELQYLAALAVERLEHDFSKPGLANRFQQYNDERLQRLRMLIKNEKKQEQLLRDGPGAGISPLKLRQQRQKEKEAEKEKQRLLLESKGKNMADEAQEAASITTGTTTAAPLQLTGTAKKAAALANKRDKHLRGNFKYPEHIYFNAMEWLYEDYDVS